MEQYVALLTAVAAHSTRVNGSVIQEAARQVFNCSPLVAQKFGGAVSKALAHCLRAGLSATSGKKLSASVRAVCLVLAKSDKRLASLMEVMCTSSDSQSQSLGDKSPYRRPVPAGPASPVTPPALPSSRAAVLAAYGFDNSPTVSSGCSPATLEVEVLSSQELAAPVVEVAQSFPQRGPAASSAASSSSQLA